MSSQNILTNTTTPPLAGSTAISVLNLAVDSLAKWFNGTATPTAGAAGLADLKGFVWHDTSTNTLKVRDQADSAWIIVGYFDETGKTFTPHTNQAAIYAADSGAANAYVLTPTPAWSSYALGGPIVCWVAAHASTGGACTANISGLGLKSIVRQDGSNPLIGDIPGTQMSVGFYNAAAGNIVLLTQRQTPLAFVKGTFSNLIVSSGGSVQTATLTADMLVLLDANNYPYLASSVNLTPSLATSGALGLDTGSVAASTWYSVWAIWNGTTMSAVYSLSTTAPTMPGGYTFKARVGWVRTDLSSNIVAFVQSGRRWQYINTGSGLPRMATGSTGAAWSSVAWAAFAPPTVGSMAIVVLRSGGGYAGGAPNGNFSATPNATNTAPIWVGANSGTWQTVTGQLIPESANVYFNGSQTGDGMFILAFEDNL